MTCPNTKTIVVFGKNKAEKVALLFNPRCKAWSCDYCAEINKDFWIHQATRGALLITSEGRDLQFVTLTSRPYATPVTGLYFFKQNWPKLRKRMADRTNTRSAPIGTEWAYFLIPERHKSGVLHAHLFAATHIDWFPLWKSQAFKSGFGWKIDVQGVVTPKQTANYVAKYLHKGAGAEVWPKGFRRVRHSQNWPIAKEREIEGWEWDTYKNPNVVWTEKHALLDMGWQVIDKTDE